ncbi:unannotated protein [freshwater metagenome]|uniref:Unannotated protein n=1 Tax=freshwater metagenome TaxID=449393 RepID=A0A6J7I5I8_9ZZZZ
MTLAASWAGSVAGVADELNFDLGYTEKPSFIASALSGPDSFPAMNEGSQVDT